MATRKSYINTSKNGKKPKANFKKEFKSTQVKTVLYNPIPSMPDSFDTKIKTFITLASTGATASVSPKVITNSLLHSADDSAGATSTFLSNVGRNYTKYRVVGYAFTGVISSRNASDCNHTIYHTPVDPAFATGTSWQGESVTRDKAFYYLVPASTKSPCIIHCSQKYDLEQIVGNSEYRTDDKYAGALSSVGVPTDPTDTTFLVSYSGLLSGGAFTASQSPQLTGVLTQFVEFYDKRV